jgi:hypothetical protein
VGIHAVPSNHIFQELGDGRNHVDARNKSGHDGVILQRLFTARHLKLRGRIWA